MSAKILNKITIYASTLILKNIKNINTSSYREISSGLWKNLKVQNLISENSISHKPFKFTNYDCVGFDLDNTICKYKVGPMVKMEYEVMASFLVKNKSYPGTHLLRPIEENLDFLMKGLILDFHNGNLLKINSKGKILKASHGTKCLNLEEIKKLYGNDCHWLVTDTFVGNPLATWNGPLSEKMRSLLDYFDMPTGLIFARLVDTLDEIEGKPLKRYDLWPDILATLTDMYDVDKFKLNQGGYFPNLKSNPDKYIEKCSSQTIEWLQSLKNQNKILFLITGSYVDFASLTSQTCLGENWSSLFDIVIFHAKKPGFFTENRPFISTKTNESAVKLEKNNWYIQGNWKDLSTFLSTVSKKQNPSVAYIGDNLLQDVYTPNEHTICDTVAIVEELQAEGAFGFPSVHNHSEYLTSNKWGSYFGDNSSEDSATFWLDVIRNHSRLCVPSMDYITCNPVDFEYKM